MRVNREEAQSLYEWSNDLGRGMTLAELGSKYGVSRERVRQCIDTSRGRKKQCARCGIMELARQGCSKDLCSSCVKHKWNTNRCRCGREKYRNSSACLVCCYKGRAQEWHKLALYLYSIGYGCCTISKAIGQKVCTVSALMWKRGVARTKSQAGFLRRSDHVLPPIQVAILDYSEKCCRHVLTSPMESVESA